MSIARKLDQFYTKPAIAENCLRVFRKKYSTLDSAYHLEPSVGAGAFFCQFPEGSRLGLDLEPKGKLCDDKDIYTQDFLTFDSSKFFTQLGKEIYVIGNPPFGKNSSLAIKFINKAAEFADVIAFILPCTFLKQSVQNKLCKNLWLRHSEPLEPNSFEFEGLSYDVPCVFQIWVKESEPRSRLVFPLTHTDFEFSSRDGADFAIRRVGGLAGKVIDDYTGYSSSSHYFIKVVGSVEACKAVMLKCDWDSVRHNTAGNPSISKRELVALYSAAKVSPTVKPKVKNMPIP